MAIRYRAQMHFQDSSGMAQWCVDQMNVRMGIAFHLREGLPGQELSVSYRDGDSYYLDAFWPDDREDLALDTRALLTDASVVGWSSTVNANSTSRSASSVARSTTSV